jgi:hypothetical protein
MRLADWCGRGRPHDSRSGDRRYNRAGARRYDRASSPANTNHSPGTPNDRALKRNNTGICRWIGRCGFPPIEQEALDGWGTVSSLEGRLSRWTTDTKHTQPNICLTSRIPEGHSEGVPLLFSTRRGCGDGTIKFRLVIQSRLKDFDRPSLERSVRLVSRPAATNQLFRRGTPIPFG